MKGGEAMVGAAAAVGTQPPGRRTGGRRRWCCWCSPRSCIGLPAATGRRARLPHRSPADDEFRPEPRPLQRGRHAPVLPAARRPARSVPGVKSVALASSVPMATDGINASNVIPEGFQLPVGKENLTLFSARVDEHYFGTMQIPDRARPRISRGRLHRRASRGGRERAVRAALLAESGSDREAVSVASTRGLDVDRDRRRRKDDEVSVARRTADRVRLSSVSPAPPIGDGAADGIGRRSVEPRRAAPRRRAGPRPDAADLQRPHDGGVLPDADDHHLQRDHRDHRQRWA